MSSTIYYKTNEKFSCCRLFNTKYLALISAIYTLNISILVVLLFTWQTRTNTRNYQDLGDVYYGIQIAYYAIIGTQLSIAFLSFILIIGIYKENTNFVVPWLIGFLTFMALEGVAIVYSSVLRDHIFGRFDRFSRTEVTFYFVRTVVNALAMWSVMRFYHLLKAGNSWKLNHNIIEL